MRNYILHVVSLCLILVNSFGTFSQVAVNNDGSPANPSSMLDVKSTSMGLLFPRLSTDQRDAIENPAAGLMVFNTDKGILEVFGGTTWNSLNGEKTSEVICGVSTVDFGGITYNTVEHNGRCWLDRNLGATRVPASIDDQQGFGHYYQWGREGDGHQHPANGTTSTVAESSNPGHILFILPASAPYDWQSPPNPNLWEPHSDYVNNPCPPDWKVPSHAEWMDAAEAWANSADAFASPLKMVNSGYRSRADGQLYGAGTGAYWSGTVFDDLSRILYIDATSVESFRKYRSWGFSIRCIDERLTEKDMLFSRAYGGNDHDRAFAIDQAGDGSLVIAGLTESYGSGNDDCLLLKLDSAGNVLTGKAYDAADAENCYSMKVTSDNGFILTGESGSDVYNLKLDPLGNVAWDQINNYGSNEGNRDVIQDPDGSFVFIGYTGGFGAGSYDYLVTKRDNSGNNVWGWAIGDTGYEYAHGLVKATDGGYAFCGYSDSGGDGGFDMQFQKLDAGGNFQWGWYMGGTDDDFGRDLTLCHDSGYVVVGNTASFGAGEYDLYVRKVNADGTTGWGSVMGGSEDEYGFSVIQTEDHGFAIAGRTSSFGGGSGDVWFVKLDSTGNFEWSWAFGGPEHESGESVIIGDDGYYYVTGYTRSFSGNGTTDDALLIKFAPDGGTCLGYYVGLPVETGGMSFKSDDGLNATPVSELSFERQTGNDSPARMKAIRLEEPVREGRGTLTTTSTSITPDISPVCEDEW